MGAVRVPVLVEREEAKGLYHPGKGSMTICVHRNVAKKMQGFLGTRREKDAQNTPTVGSRPD